MNILEQIAFQKRKEISVSREQVPVSQLLSGPGFERPTNSFSQAIQQAVGPAIIAEFKRRSPSKGTINSFSDPLEVTNGYRKAGAVAISILTDNMYFGGSNDDLLRVREHTGIPVLRKEFILDPYQVYESRAIGADAILLIAALLTPDETLELAKLARSLELDTLLEVHNREELNRLNEHIRVVGVNNRNLADFRVSLDTSLSLADAIPVGIPRISESGIRQADDIRTLWNAGYQGFLIGETFMATPDPVAACHMFMNQLKDRIDDKAIG